MDRNVAEFIADAVDGEIREDYSGRGSRRETCGVVFDGNVTDIIRALYENAEDIAHQQEQGDLPPSMGRIRMDNMGTDTIIY